MTTPPAWVEEAIALQDQDRIDDAIDIIFDHFDDLHHNGKFTESDAALAVTDVNRLGEDLLVAVLAITRLAAKHLPSRPAFVAKVRAKIHAEQPDAVDSIMRGLEE